MGVDGKVEENDIIDYAVYDLGRGWKARVEKDKSHEEGQKHVHVYNGEDEWAQNEDGTQHDKSRTRSDTPSASVRKALKKKTGWDWDANKAKLSHSEGDQMVTDSGELYEFRNGDWEYIGQYQRIPGLPVLLPGTVNNIPGGLPTIDLPIDVLPVPAV